MPITTSATPMATAFLGVSFLSFWVIEWDCMPSRLANVRSAMEPIIVAVPPVIEVWMPGL